MALFLGPPAFDAEALEVDLWPWEDLELGVLEAVAVELPPLETSDPGKVFRTFKATQLYSATSSLHMFLISKVTSVPSLLTLYFVYLDLSSNRNFLCLCHCILSFLSKWELLSLLVTLTSCPCETAITSGTDDKTGFSLVLSSR